MSAYSSGEKALHKLYLSNYFISRSSLEIEEAIYGPKASKMGPEQYVFVTGLARSGTTALMRNLFNTGHYASLQYSNMPMLLMPNLWNRNPNLDKHERAHQDGILVDGNSPEEFDEYFWKVFLKDNYISDSLSVHDVSDRILHKYETYVRLICLSKGKKRYLSKNNNNILRLHSIALLPNAQIVVMFREPFSHASSLLKLHRKFSATQSADTFSLDYFNYLGHHEFGIGHKPFLLTPKFEKRREKLSPDTIDYWIAVWINYYQYLLELKEIDFYLVDFNCLISEPEYIYTRLWTDLDIGSSFVPTQSKHTPSKYSRPENAGPLLDEATSIYDSLKRRTISD